MDERLIYFSVSGAINASTSLFICILVLHKNYNSVINRTFALFSFYVALWSIAYIFWPLAQTKEDCLFWFRMHHIGAILIPAGFFHFVISYLGMKKIRQVIIAYLLAFLFLVFSFSPFFIFDMKPKLFFPYYGVMGILYVPFLLMFFWYALYSLYLLFRQINRLNAVKRNQTFFIALGTLIGFIGGGTNYLLWFDIPVPPYGNILVSVYVILVAYAIIKYRLMDIKLAVTRAGIFVFVYALVLGIPIWIGLRLLGRGLWLWPVTLMGFFATVGPFVYLYMQKRAEDRLLQEQRRYQATLRQASAGMGKIKDLKKLLNMIVYVLTHAIQIEHALVYIYEEDKKEYVLGASKRKAGQNKFIESFERNFPLVEYFLENKNPLIFEEINQKTQDSNSLQLTQIKKFIISIDGALLVPIFIDQNLTAIIVMGRKESGKVYTEDDLAVFSILANQTALAIENAIFYEQMNLTHEQLFQAEKMATIGTMADGLSHQINNRFHALGFIAGDALDTIKMNKKELSQDKMKEVLAELERAFNRVQENVVQGGEIVSGLLRYTRKGDAGFTPVDVDAVLKSALEMVQFKIKVHELKIIREYDLATMPKVKGNFTQLQEVFFNLIDNGYDAMMQRKNEQKEFGYQPTLIVRVFKEDHLVRIIFEDNGIGVKDEDTHKLFTPFFTTKLSSKKGTGLGLYVIRKIIEDNHKGQVEMISKYMQGTQMKLRLPIAIG